MPKASKQISREINEALDKFAQVRSGTLVRRSRHWYRIHTSDVKGQLGIVVDRDVHEEGGRLVTYPVIHWEGQHGPSGTHPDNVEIAPSAFTRALGIRRSK
jgi:hypothetical protein